MSSGPLTCTPAPPLQAEGCHDLERVQSLMLNLELSVLLKGLPRLQGLLQDLGTHSSTQQGAGRGSEDADDVKGGEAGKKGTSTQADEGREGVEGSVAVKKGKKGKKGTSTQRKVPGEEGLGS